MAVKPGGAWWILGMGAISTYGEVKEYPAPGNTPFENIFLVPSTYHVDVSWIPPPPGSGLNTDVSYVIYRDGVLIAETTETQYRDEGLELDTTYEYKICSKNIYGVLSESCPTKETTTLNLPPSPATISCTGRRKINVTNYDPTYVYEIWEGATKVGSVDSSGNYTVAKDNTAYDLQLKTIEGAPIWHSTTFMFKAYRYTADTRREVCSESGCGGDPNCAPGCGPTCATGCCPHCNCCVRLYCHRCWTEGSAPQLINEPGFTNVGGNWFKTPA